MADYVAIFQPFVDLFNQGQIQTILIAWLPTKIESLLSGIIAVDMFVTTALASGITVTLAAIIALSQSLFTGTTWNQNLVTVQVEYYTTGTYGDQYASLFYEALSWLISKQTQKLDKGSFIVQHANTITDTDDECAPPGFNILPEKNQEIVIEYNERKFHVTFNMPESEANNNSDGNNNSSGSSTKAMPSIYLTTVKDSKTSVESVSDFINEITRAYLESQRKEKVRSRYERNDGYWYRIQTLSSNRGLDSVALDKPQEKLLKKEIDTFINDKDFYRRIGMPYRRGILLYGRPGTGKTSLINAISSQLSRDLYYLNLKNITDDNELSAAFSSIPANQILVLEDVDTQSKVIHRRGAKQSSYFESSSSSSGEKTAGPSNKGSSDTFSMFSLSTFLSCCDGHILAEGIIIIMTTNHVEVLDPACIRPGRFDLHLDLGYATHYQITKMYKSVAEDPEAEFPPEIMSKIPERLLPPCEVMMTMVLYRNELELMPHKVCELVDKYRNMKPEEIAKQMEEEAARISNAANEEEKENETSKSENTATTTSETTQESNVKKEIKPIVEGAATEETKKEVVAEETKKEVVAEETKKEVIAEETKKEVIAEETKKEIVAEETKKEIVAEETKKEIVAEETKKEIVAEGIKKEIFAEELKEKNNDANTIQSSNEAICTNNDDTDSSTDVESDVNIPKKGEILKLTSSQIQTS